MAVATLVSPARSGQSTTLSVRARGRTLSSAFEPTLGQVQATTDLPLIIGPERAGEVHQIDANGLTGVSQIEWFENSVSQGTSTNYTPMVPGVFMFARVTHANGVTDTPFIWVLLEHADASHVSDEDQIMALFPQNQATVIAVADGDFSNPATWSTGEVPGQAARILIPEGRDITYDIVSSPRLWDMRIDGTLRWTHDHSTHLLIETVLITSTGAMIIGNSVNDRIPENVNHEIVISDRSFALDPTGSAPTVIDIANDPGLFGRGIICLGLRRTFGHFHTPWKLCDDAAWPMAGDTSVTLKETPTDWRIGGKIAISGMRFDIINKVFQDQSEVRTITSVNGNEVFWDAGQPLIHDHDDDLDRTAHTNAEDDTVPAVAYLERNIVFRSEAPHVDEPWLRGHTMVMHGVGVLDGWAHKVLDMGRTDKNRPAGRIEPSNGQFRFVNWDPADGDDTGGQLVYEAPTPQMNLISRYAEHMHFLGFERGNEMATLRECLVQGVVGWGVVQHACEAKIINNVIYDFANGMISETGDELNAWVDNCVFGCNSKNAEAANVKFTEGGPSSRGDKFRVGICYGFTGRAMRVSGNFAGSAPQGFTFNHRSGKDRGPDDPYSTISPKRDLERRYADIGALSEMNWQNGKLTSNDYPIRHFNGNICAGVDRTFMVTKSGPTQNTDIGINLRNFKAYAVNNGPFQEYVATYNWVFPYVQTVERPLSNFNKVALQSGGASFQITYLEAKLVGPFNAHFNLGAGSKFALPEDFNNTNNPMFSLLGTIISTGSLLVDYNPLPSVEPFGDMEDATRIGAAPAFSKPVISGPLVAYYWNGRTDEGCLTNIATYTRDDSLGSQTLPKTWDPVGLRFGSFTNNVTGPRDFTWQTGGYLRSHAARKGYWTWDDNGTIRDVLKVRLEHSDRRDGYTINHDYLIVCEGTTWEDKKSDYTNNGVLVPTTTPPSRADVQVAVPKNGSVILDILTAATSEAGTTIDYLKEDFDGTIKIQHLKPDRGDLVINPDNTITYTPDRDYVSKANYTGAPVDPDIGYMFLTDGRTGYETVRLEFTVS